MNCPRCNDPAEEATLREFGGVCPKCLLRFAEEKDAPAFPNLEILEMLGQGGMGVVYKARQKNLDRTVALKVLSPQLSSDPEFVERFTREARALAQLNHPNIVGIYESGIHDKVPYLVMEYVEGKSLRQLLAAKELTASQALEVVPQICDALYYGHARGVVHRDIKPENILLDASGRVKIADYGLAKIASLDQSRITRSDVTLGTPHYMAPEQIERSGQVDHRADIYSLGVVFYEMLTGELPLGRFKPPSEKSEVDRRLDRVVLKSLEKEPADRYQSAEEVKAQLTRMDRVPPATEFPPYSKVAVAAGVCFLLTVTFFGLLLSLARTDETAAGVFAVLTVVSLVATFGLSVGGIVVTVQSRGALRGGWIAHTSLAVSILTTLVGLGWFFVAIPSSSPDAPRVVVVPPSEEPSRPPESPAPARESKLLWRHYILKSPDYSDLVSTDYGVFGISEAQVIGLSPATGEQKGGAPGTIEGHAAANNWIVIWGGGRLLIYQSTDSGLLGRDPLPIPFPGWIAGAVIDAGVFFAQSHNGHVAAVDLRRGEVLWTSDRTPEGAVDGAPVVDASDVLTFDDSGVQVRDRLSGRFKKRIPGMVPPWRTLQWREGYVLLREAGDVLSVRAFAKNGLAALPELRPTSRPAVTECHLAVTENLAVLTTVNQVFGLPRHGSSPAPWSGTTIPDTTGPITAVGDVCVAIPTVQGIVLFNTEDGRSESLSAAGNREYTRLACWKDILVAYTPKNGEWAGFRIAEGQPRKR